MADNERILERRLARLEALVSVLILFEGGLDYPETSELLYRLLREYPSDKEQSRLMRELYYLLRKRPFPSRFRDFINRLERAEGQWQELSVGYSNLREQYQNVSSNLESLEYVRHQQDMHDEQISSLRKDIGRMSENQSILQNELHTYLIARSLGLDPDNMSLHRFVPINIYVDEYSEKSIDRISKALSDYARQIGFEFSDDFPPETGSWYKRWFAKTKEGLTHDEVIQRLKKAERALELATLHKHQASVDKDQATGAAELIKSLENTPNAACQIGSLLIVKVTDKKAGACVQVRTMTPSEMILLEKNKDLLKDPKNILDGLNQSDIEKKALLSEQEASPE